MLWHDDADLASRDDPLRDGLQLVFDNERLVELVRSLHPRAQVHSLQTNYVRYKPGTSCIVGFRAKDESGATGLGYAKVSADEPPRAYLFPYDDALQGLAKIQLPELNAALARELNRRNQSCDASLQFAPLAYKPERRFVASVSCSLAERPIAVIKFFEPSGFVRATNSIKAVRSMRHLRVPRRLAKLGRYSLMVSQWIEGRTIDQAIADGAAAAQVFKHVGAALADLHSQPTDGLLRLTPQAITKQITAAARLVAHLAPDLTPLADEIVSAIRSRLRALPETVTLHGDFHTRQVLLTDVKRSVAMLDLDEAAAGHPAYDLGNFIAHLHSAGAPIEQTITAGNALHRGYSKHGGSACATRDSISLYAAIGCLKLAPHSFRARRENWRDDAERMLTIARDLLRTLPTSATTSRPSGQQAALPLLIEDPFNARQDRRLGPFVAAAADQQQASAELQEAMSGALLREGGEPIADLQLTRARITRCKPGRRCMIEYDVQLTDARGQQSRMTVIGKIRAKGVDTSQSEIYAAIRAAGFGAEAADGVLVPQPLGVIPLMAMTLQKKVLGIPASTFLEDYADTRAAGRIAAAIVKLHRANVTPRKRHTISDEMRVLREALASAGEARPDLRTAIDKIYRECESLAGSLVDREPSCGVHRDFYPDQVLLAGARIYLLDFDLYCQGDPALDAGNFIAHLIDQSIRNFDGDAAHLATHQQEFLEAFVALHGEPIRAAADAYTTLSLARLIAISTRMPERHTWTATLIDACRERLASGCSAMK